MIVNKLLNSTTKSKFNKMKVNNFLIIIFVLFLTVYVPVLSSENSYAPDEQSTTYNFYEKYFLPVFPQNLTIDILDDKLISDKEFPTEGSFFSNIVQFNNSLVNYTIHMAIAMSREGFMQPDDMVQGEFNPNINFNSLNKVDYFGQKWQNQDYQIARKSSQIINDLTQKIKSLYINELALLTGNDTTEIVFISDNDQSHQEHSNALIARIYADLDILKLLIKDPVFSMKSFQNNFFNQQNKLPVTSYFPLELSANSLGFDIPYLCNKFINWLDYSQSDSNLIGNYTSLFYDVHSTFIENFNNSKFYTQFGQLWLDLSEDNIRTNLTLGYILSNSLYADAVLFGIPQVGSFLPPQIINNFLNMHNFLRYEYFLYSDLHSSMIISPFIEFMMSEFNLKINNFKNSNTYPANPRKIVWFTTHENNISALFKLLNYDYRVKQIGGFLSILNTWNNPKQSIDNNFSYFPYIGYGYTVSFELLSVIDSISGKRIFYIGLRDNFSASYLFVISLRAFNKLAKLIMMVPSYTQDERNLFCN